MNEVWNKLGVSIHSSKILSISGVPQSCFISSNYSCIKIIEFTYDAFDCFEIFVIRLRSLYPSFPASNYWLWKQTKVKKHLSIFGWSWRCSQENFLCCRSLFINIIVRLVELFGHAVKTVSKACNVNEIDVSTAVVASSM